MHLSRRRLLTAAAGASALSLLPVALVDALKKPAAKRRGTGGLDQIEHVMILMQENRSFDHYFGTLSGVRGFDDPDAVALPGGASVFRQPDPARPGGYTLPFHMDTTTTSAAKYPFTDHSWRAQHQSWNQGAMDGWLATHRTSDKGPWTMGHYTRQDIPFHYALADAFTVCDAYHASAFGPTRANRLFAISGTNDPDGRAGGPVVSNDQMSGFRWTTYPERLEQAGVSWRYYVGNSRGSDLGWFDQFRTASRDSALWRNGVQARLPTAVADDIRAGDLPAVSWLNSQYLTTYGMAEASEHAPGTPGAGADYIWHVLQALGDRPDVWAKTVLFIVYDENDGLFDHVPPPVAPPGTPGEWITVNPLPAECEGISGPIGLGFRVPMIVVSPWSFGGYVCSDLFDHTSLLRFLETRFGVAEPNISDWRRRICGDLTSTLRLHEFDAAMPRLPDASALAARQFRQAAQLPTPAPPDVQSMPRQEPGTRPRVPAAEPAANAPTTRP